MDLTVRKILFLDLDDTVFQSLRKCGPAGELQPIAFLPDGQAHGFATQPQQAFLQWLAEGAEIIPTTARNFASYQRVRLPIKAPLRIILNHGGTILEEEGMPSRAWQQRMRLVMEPWVEPLEILCGEINEWATKTHPSIYARVIGDLGQTLYVLVKDREQRHAVTMPLLRGWLDPWITEHAGLALHQNGNNLTVMPSHLDKAHAVEFLLGEYRAKHGDVLALGAGDSRSDLDFLKLCDYAIVPRGAQIFT